MAVFHITFMSKTLYRTVNIVALIPTDKVSLTEPEKVITPSKFKTLYLLHGVFGSENDWLYGTRIQRWADEKNLAVIMPAGENAFYLDHPDWFENYGAFIGKELVEFTRRTFPLSERREDTFIGGLSMGGFGAIRNGLKYHETFGAIAALSAAINLNEENLAVMPEDHILPPLGKKFFRTHMGSDLYAAMDTDVHPRYLVKQILKSGSEIPKLYLACGTEDAGCLPLNENFHEFLLQNGVEHTWVTGPGVHDWDFWDSQIKKVLEWLPLGEVSSGTTSGSIDA